MSRPGEPLGTSCPRCRVESRRILGGGTQAFCLNYDCDVFTWNPGATWPELAGGLQVIDSLTFLEGDE